jgi:hypothetical protein
VKPFALRIFITTPSREKPHVAGVAGDGATAMPRPVYWCLLLEVLYVL